MPGRQFNFGYSTSIVRATIQSPTMEEYLVNATETEDYGVCIHFKVTNDRIQFCSVTTKAEEKWSDEEELEYTFCA